LADYTSPNLLRRPSRIDIGITLLAIGVLIVNVEHHDMWHDEINAFEIALHSPTLPALFHNLHYEGHPPLWYLMLWVASTISANPLTTQVVHTVIVILIYVIVGLFSPFSTLEKLLLLSGYFLGFEYAVISRNYSLGVLFALLYAELRSKRPDQIVLNGALLGLLANTTVFGLMMSGAFACEYALECITRARRTGEPRAGEVAAGAAVYVAFVVGSVLTIIPAPDIGEHGSTYLFQFGSKLWHLKLAAVSVVGLSFVPFDADFPSRFWIGMEPAMRKLWEIREAGSVLATVALVAIFRRDLRLLLVIAATGAAATLFCHLIYLSGIRQTGIFFVAVLTALWMQRVHRPRGNWVIPALLLCGSVAGIEAQVGQWMRPFTYSRVAAQFLIDNGWRDAGLIGYRDDWAVAVTEILDRPLYGLDCGCFEDFLQFSARHKNVETEQFGEHLARAVAQVKGAPALLIYSNPWGLRGDLGLDRAGLRAELVADFHGSESGEDYLIFLISPL